MKLLGFADLKSVVNRASVFIGAHLGFDLDVVFAHDWSMDGSSFQKYFSSFKSPKIFGLLNVEPISAKELLVFNEHCSPRIDEISKTFKGLTMI